MNLTPWIIGTLTWLAFAATVCLIRKNNGLVDIFWGLGFVVLASVSFASNQSPSVESIAVTGLVLIWGLRLSIYLFYRNWNKPEDFRYAAWRKDWGKHWVFFSIFKVYLLQALIMQVIALPIFVVNVINGFNQNTIAIQSIVKTSFIVLGSLISLLGIALEAIADKQKSNFTSQTKNSQKICQEGLWKISRHPNYMGEILTWVGIGIIPMGLHLGFLAGIAPVFITLLLYFVSGVPLLEKRMEGRLDFEQYKKNTGAIFPRLF